MLGGLSCGRTVMICLSWIVCWFDDCLLGVLLGGVGCFLGVLKFSG